MFCHNSLRPYYNAIREIMIMCGGSPLNLVAMIENIDVVFVSCRGDYTERRYNY